jgi:acyl transferase domain-containing protein
MVPKLAANPASQQAAVPAADLAKQLQSLAGNQSDAVLGTLTKDLSATFKSLSDSLAGNPAVKSQLSSLTAALAGGKEAEALGASSLLAAAQLTPEQKKLAGDARNLLGAYVTQKNFATLPGAQNEVAAIVDSLRKGDLMAAAAPMQKVAANASLTPAQKDVVSSLVKSYAPGVKDATDKLGGALKGLVPK